MVEYKIEYYEVGTDRANQMIRNELKEGWHPISISVTESGLSSRIKYILFKKG